MASNVLQSIPSGTSDASVPSPSSSSVSAVSEASSAEVTSTSHGLTTGDTVTISGVVGADAAKINQKGLVVTVVDSSHFTVPVNTTGLGYTSGGTVQKTAGKDIPVILDNGGGAKATGWVGICTGSSGIASGAVSLEVSHDAATWISVPFVVAASTVTMAVALGQYRYCRALIGTEIGSGTVGVTVQNV